MDFMDFNFGGADFLLTVLLFAAAGFLVVTVTYPGNYGDKRHYWLS